MSNIEPTEEQRAAAATLVFGETWPAFRSTAVARWVKAGVEDDGIDLCGADEIAQLLAEREAKLREEIYRQAWNLGGISVLAASRTPQNYDEDMALPALNDVAALLADNDTLRARVAELERLDRDRDRALYLAEVEYFAASAREAQHLARIAELEASRDHPRTWAAVEAREAQHLADIKALKSSRDDAVQRAVDLFDEYRRAGFVSPHPAVDLGEAFHLDLDARLAHYHETPLDDDNIRAAFKAVRDAVAEFLGVDDGEERLHFIYQQTKAVRTGVKQSKPGWKKVKDKETGEVTRVRKVVKNVAAYDTRPTVTIEVMPVQDIDPQAKRVRELEAEVVSLRSLLDEQRKWFRKTVDDEIEAELSSTSLKAAVHLLSLAAGAPEKRNKPAPKLSRRVDELRALLTDDDEGDE